MTDDFICMTVIYSLKHTPCNQRDSVKQWSSHCDDTEWRVMDGESPAGGARSPLLQIISHRMNQVYETISSNVSVFYIVCFSCPVSCKHWNEVIVSPVLLVQFRSVWVWRDPLVPVLRDSTHTLYSTDWWSYFCSWQDYIREKVKRLDSCWDDISHNNVFLCYKSEQI